MITVSVEPEMLGRKDSEHGNWNVDTCNPRRGEPYTDLINKGMKVPMHDTDLARVIRAHELMHAKVSPALSYTKWIDRKIATLESLVVVEELRVNFLCEKAGFDMKNKLTDGGETADGERVAATKDWAGAVQMTIATAGTASSKAFLNGVRRHNAEWGVILVDISKRAVKEMEKAYRKGRLASTDVDAVTGLAPFGYSHTERIAEWVDRLSANAPQEPEEEVVSGSSSGESEEESPAPRKRGRPAKAKAGGHSNEGIGKVGSATGKPYQGITPSAATGINPSWAELVVERCPMPRNTKGSIGKKRTASNIGRSPRRIHRLITDPEKRVFDKVTRGTGGVVIIDGSGSMSFTHDQIRKMVECAPGATVAVYTDRGTGKANMWVVADKGKMVSELPNFGFGNGVDFPALEWAVKNRQRPSSPIIWVTDGGVCPARGGFNDLLAMQCVTYCKKNNIIVLPYVEEALSELRKMKAGQKGKSQWPFLLRQAHKNMMGSSII